MHFLMPLAALLGFEVEAITDRVKRTILLNGLMALFGLVGAIFLLVAAYLALADWLSPLYAALIIAGVFLLAALSVYVSNQIAAGRAKREALTKKRSNETSAFVTTAALTALPALLKSPLVRRFGLPAAALAAFLLVRNGGDRSDD